MMAAAPRIFERRELNTILAALLCYQAEFLVAESSLLTAEDYAEIASDGGVVPLTSAEIDALSEWLNSDEMIFRNKRPSNTRLSGPLYLDSGR